MKQSIIKVPGSEDKLDRVLARIINKNLKISTMTIAGGGFLSEIVTYIVVEDTNDDINFKDHIQDIVKESGYNIEVI